MMERSSGAGTILLVEDNPGDIRLIQEAFMESDIDSTLHIVTDGGEALDFLYQRGDYTDAPRPDLMLLDLDLPRTSGFEVLETIGDDLKLSLIPVLVVTGSDDKMDIVRSYTLGINGYLTKSCSLDQTVSMVQTIEDFWFDTVKLPSLR